MLKKTERIDDIKSKIKAAVSVFALSTEDKLVIPDKKIESAEKIIAMLNALQVLIAKK